MTYSRLSSVTTAGVLPDEGAEVAGLASDHPGCETTEVPHIFGHELRSSLLLLAERRKRIDACRADASMARLYGPGIQHVEEAHDHAAMALASLDRRLIMTAVAEGVMVLV